MPKTTKHASYIEGIDRPRISRASSNWRSQQVAENISKQFQDSCAGGNRLAGLCGNLRDHGVMRGVVSKLETDSTSWWRRRDHPQDGWS